MNTKSIHWRGFLTEGMDLCQRGARTNYVLNGAAAIGHSGDQGCSKFWFFWCKCTIPGMTLTERNKENTLESLDDYLDSDICIYIHTLPFESFYKKADIFLPKKCTARSCGFFRRSSCRIFSLQDPIGLWLGMPWQFHDCQAGCPDARDLLRWIWRKTSKKNKTCLFLREHF